MGTQAWCLRDPYGNLWPSSCREYRSGTIRFMERVYENARDPKFKNWRYWYRRGWRVVKARVTEI